MTARALLGALALYGLLLQPFFAAATPLPAPDSAGVLCAAHDAAGPGSPDLPAGHDHACCTAAHLGGLTVPPAPAFAIVAWSVPHVVVAGWRPVELPPKTGPPTHSHTPRGPPSA